MICAAVKYIDTASIYFTAAHIIYRGIYKVHFGTAAHIIYI